MTILIHVRPTLLSPFIDEDVSLVDVVIDEFDINLRGGTDLKSGRPYPNKHYVVAYPKSSRKALEGLFIETDQPVTTFNMVTRWVIGADFVAVHRCEYRLLDDDFDAASDHMIFWHATSASLGGWECRLPKSMGEPGQLSPIALEPKMKILATGATPTSAIVDQSSGWISELSQTFDLPTIQRARLLGQGGAVHLYDRHQRMPPVESIFRR